MTRGEWEGNNRGKMVRVKSRDMYKGPMVKDNGVGIVFGSGGWTEQGRTRGGKWGQLQLNNNKKMF